jgi:hypothetical protein
MAISSLRTALLLTLGLSLAAWPVGAQAPQRRAWFTTVGEVRATADGWVELRIAPPAPVPPHNSEFFAVTARFTPDTVRTWAEAVRRLVDDTAAAPMGKVSLPRLTVGHAGIRFEMIRDSMRTRYELSASGCRGGGDGSSSRGDAILLVDALTQAARTASALRSVPADRGEGPSSLAQVTCPAWIQRTMMPAWSATFGPRPATRGEALARFVITEHGRIDLATLSWDRAPAPGPAQAARAALAEWRFGYAIVGRRRAPQWGHAIVWFADSSDAAERQQAGWTRTRSFVTRRDGRIEHAYLHPWIDSLWTSDEEPRMREAYPPAAVRAWMAGRQRADGNGPRLTVPGGLTLHGQVTGAGILYDGCHAHRTTATGGIPRAAQLPVTDSLRAALAEAERRPVRRVDSTRVHGETEVTCPARPRGRLSSTLTSWPGADEAILSFVVRRDGRVDPHSVVVLGDSGAGNSGIVRAALLNQQWHPGRLAGVRVPQRAHLVLYPGTEQAGELTTEACVQSSAVAVRLRVREPIAGIASQDLTRVAYTMSRNLAFQGRPASSDGTFSVVLDDTGASHFFNWTRPPSDTAGERAARSGLGQQVTTIVGEPMVPPLSALALEGELLRACP